MPKFAQKFLKKTMQGNRNRVALRIPPELEEWLQTKAKESGCRADEFVAFV